MVFSTIQHVEVVTEGVYTLTQFDVYLFAGLRPFSPGCFEDVGVVVFGRAFVWLELFQLLMILECKRIAIVGKQIV